MKRTLTKPTLYLGILLTSLMATTALACPEHDGAKKPPCCPKDSKASAMDEVCLKHKKGGHAGHDAHAGHSSHASAQPAANPAVAAYETGMAKMHEDMAITYTGDADYDFVVGMIPHHQGAIDMAQVVMQYGRDPQVRKLAMEVIRAQNLEIRWMQAYMKQLEAKGLKPVAADAKPKPGYTDKGWIGDFMPRP